MWIRARPTDILADVNRFDEDSKRYAQLLLTATSTGTSCVVRPAMVTLRVTIKRSPSSQPSQKMEATDIPDVGLPKTASVVDGE